MQRVAKEGGWWSVGCGVKGPRTGLSGSRSRRREEAEDLERFHKMKPPQDETASSRRRLR
jgi:hypothetical protein